MRGFPLSGVGHHADIILRAELTFITQSCLSLFDGFTRIVLFSARRLLRIGFPFRFGESAGIVRLNVHTIKNQREFTDIVKAHAQFGISQIFSRAAVIAVAVGGETGSRYRVIHVARLCAVTHRARGF
ncbi:hypothetical protein NGUA15_00408 [Salmonella enterica]|nr:hypothetical protein NGUA15_00408 [Salmonella enterica]